MKLTLVPTALCIAAALALGCSKEPAGGDDHGHDHGAEADDHGHDHDAGTGHGAAGAVPGSHEDWCGEHAVPESKCTRCDPSLVAAFKATNDWCAEHGLPESQCLKCNPDLEIERPPKTGGSQ
jgi:hypothetical protein